MPGGRSCSWTAFGNCSQNTGRLPAVFTALLKEVPKVQTTADAQLKHQEVRIADVGHVPSTLPPSSIFALVQTREATCCLRSCKNGRASCVKCKSTRACKTCAKGFRVGAAGSCGKIPPPPYRRVPVFLHRAGPTIVSMCASQLHAFSDACSVCRRLPFLSTQISHHALHRSFVSPRRCQSGKAKCRKCKSTKACKTCATGFKVGPKGSCVAIPKPPPYKCAAEPGAVCLCPPGLLSLATSDTPEVTLTLPGVADRAGDAVHF